MGPRTARELQDPASAAWPLRRLRPREARATILFRPPSTSTSAHRSMPSTYRRCSNGVRQQRDRHRFAHTWLAPFLCGAVTVGHEQRRSSSHPTGKVCRKVEAGRPSRARMDGARTAPRLQTELGSFITSPKSDHITSIKILLDPASSLAEILASLRTRPATAGRLLRPHHID